MFQGCNVSRCAHGTIGSVLNFAVTASRLFFLWLVAREDLMRDTGQGCTQDISHMRLPASLLGWLSCQRTKLDWAVHLVLGSICWVFIT